MNIYRTWLRDYPNVCFESIDVQTQRQILFVQEQLYALGVLESKLWALVVGQGEGVGRFRFYSGLKIFEDSNIYSLKCSVCIH